MKKFICLMLLKDNIDPADLKAYAEPETARFQALLDTKVIDHYYSKLGYPKFWCIINALSHEEAIGAMHSLPYYEQGYLMVEIEELTENRHK